uniref:muscarinic acetylcholine receptor M1-like n=1 Tax=Myxine glutinosa TaxID=7769 RepID=UPI00358E6198
MAAPPSVNHSNTSSSAQTSTTYFTSADLTSDLPSLTEVIIVVILTTALSLVTITGNTLVLVAFKVNIQLRTVNNYFLLSLACADLIIGLLSMNLYTTYLALGRWPLGRVACHLWLALDYVASNASVLNLLAISVDRYLSVTRPLTYRAKRTPGRATAIIALAWGVSLVLWAPPILSWEWIGGHDDARSSDKSDSDCTVGFFNEPLITFGTAFAAFYLPCVVMCVLYWRIYMETEKRTKELAALQGSDTDSESANVPKLETASRTGQGRHLHCWCCLPAQQAWRSPAIPWHQRPTRESWRSQCSGPSPLHSAVSDDGQVLGGLALGNPGETSGKGLGVPGSEAGTPIGSEDGGGGRRRGSAGTPTATPTAGYSATSRARRRRANGQTGHPKERKAAQTLTAILLAFMVTWSPYNVLVLVAALCQTCVPPPLWRLAYWLCYVNSAANPLCYALCNPRFRHTFRSLLLCHKRHNHHHRHNKHHQHHGAKNRNVNTVT